MGTAAAIGSTAPGDRRSLLVAQARDKPLRGNYWFGRVDTEPLRDCVSIVSNCFETPACFLIRGFHRIA